MSQNRQTPDERLVIKLYQVAVEKGDPFLILDVNHIAQSLGQKETAVKNIVKHLAQANFLKKVGDKNVHLTERGCALAIELLNA